MSLEISDKHNSPGGRKILDGNIDETGLRQEYLEAGEAYKKENPVGHAYLETIMRSISGRALKEIFSERLRRSGVTLENANFPSLAYCIIRNKESLAPFGYDPDANLVILNAPWIRSVPSPSATEKAITLGDFTGIFSSVVHELTHAYGAVRIKDSKEPGNERFDMMHSSRQTGFQLSNSITRVDKITNEKKHFSAGDFGKWFNEGVTELISQEIALEYMKREPPAGGAYGVIGEDIRRRLSEQEWPYSIAAMFVERFTEHIAAASNVPKDTVWNALVRSYFRGDLLSDEQFATGLRDVFGADFVEKVKSAREIEELRKITEEYKMDSLDDTAAKAIFERLQINEEK